MKRLQRDQYLGPNETVEDALLEKQDDLSTVLLAVVGTLKVCGTLRRDFGE